MGATRHRERIPTTPFDALLAGALAAWAATSMLTIGPADPPLRVVLGVLVPLGLALRTRLPTVSAVWVGTAVVAESLITEPPDELAVIVSVVVASYSVWANARASRAWWGSAALAVALVVANLFDASDDLANLAAGVPLFLVVPAWIGFEVRRRQQAAERVRAHSERVAAEAATAVEDERRRIARDLHDVVAHAVTLVAVQAEAGQAVIDHDRDAARRSLESIGRASRDALAELDRMLGLLASPVEATAAPGLDRLHALATGAADAGLVLAVRSSGPVGRLSAEADHCAYRVAQEGLTNAVRHGDGDRLEVHLRWSGEALRMELTSTGHRTGGDYGGSGRGLDGLAERLVAVGGRLEAADPSPDGFVLVACLPVTTARTAP